MIQQTTISTILCECYSSYPPSKSQLTHKCSFSAKEFVANVTQNPLAFGQNETTRSDFRIFNADGGKVISQLANSEDFFLSTCNTLLERMINTVPRGVKLTDIINPIAVKPRNLFITPNTDGTLYVNGFIRVRMESFTYNKHNGNFTPEKANSLK